MDEEKISFENFIKARGWEFFQDSPTEGKWMLFDNAGKRIGIEGDNEWNELRKYWEKL